MSYFAQTPAQGYEPAFVRDMANESLSFKCLAIKYKKSYNPSKLTKEIEFAKTHFRSNPYEPHLRNLGLISAYYAKNPLYYYLVFEIYGVSDIKIVYRFDKNVRYVDRYLVSPYMSRNEVRKDDSCNL